MSPYSAFPRIRVFFKVLSLPWYTHQPPSIWQPRMMTDNLSAEDATPLLNCPLYAGTIVFTVDWHTRIELLKMCETHGLQVGKGGIQRNVLFWINRTKPLDLQTLWACPASSAFVCLPGCPIQIWRLSRSSSSYLNCSKASVTMNILNTTGVNPTGSSQWLSSRFYAHIVCRQMEYGLASHLFTSSQWKQHVIHKTNARERWIEPWQIVRWSDTSCGETTYYDRKSSHFASSVSLSLLTCAGGYSS